MKDWKSCLRSASFGLLYALLVDHSAARAGPPPANDACADAIEVVSGEDYSGSFAGATVDGSAVNEAGDVRAEADVWYRFVPSVSGTLRLNTCGTHDFDGVDVGADTILSLHASCPGDTPVQLAFNDDATAGACGTLDQELLRDSVLLHEVSADETYWIRASSFVSSASSFLLSVSLTPANDNCSAASEVIPDGSGVVGTLVNATNDGTSTVGMPGQPDVWYRLTAPLAGTLRVHTCGTFDRPGPSLGVDTVLSLHTDCPEAGGIEIVANDDGATCVAAEGLFRDSEMKQPVEEGDDVWIRVAPHGLGVTQGDFVLTADLLPAGPTDLRVEDVAGTVELSWRNGRVYDSIAIARDGVPLDVRPGSAQKYTDESPDPGPHEYSVFGIVEGFESSAVEVSVDVFPVLFVDTAAAVSVQLDTERTRAWFRFTEPAGSSLFLELSDADPPNSNVLYVRWEEAARPFAFDLAALERGRSAQTLALSETPAGAGSVLVERDTLMLATPSTVTLRLRPEALFLQSIAPAASARGGSGRVSVRVRGAGFNQTSALALESSAGTGTEAVDVVLRSEGLLEAVFEIENVAPGDYNVVCATVGAGGLREATLTDGFRVLASDEGPQLEASLLAFSLYRQRGVGEQRPLGVIYQNVGDAEVVAPLLKIDVVTSELECMQGVNGSREASLRTGDEPAFREGSLTFFGSGHDVSSGRLAADEERGAFLFYKNPDACCDACKVDIRLSLFSPGNAALPWSNLPRPEGVSAGSWPELRAALADRLGTAARDVHEALADINTRLGRRDAEGLSAIAPFRLAVREVLGRPTTAIVGRLRDSHGVPVTGVVVAAAVNGVVQSTATSGFRGLFAIDWLRGDIAYQLLVDGHTVLGVSPSELRTPSTGDLLGVEITALGDPGVIVPESCFACDETNLPEEPLAFPASMFVEVGRRLAQAVSSVDPNEKDGSSGPLPGRSTPDQLSFYIQFENEGRAPVQNVKVFDTLDPNLDPTTIEWGPILIRRGSVPASVSLRQRGSYEAKASGTVRSIALLDSRNENGDFDLAEGDPIQVNITARMRQESGVATPTLEWELACESCSDLGGFLGPEESGAVSFRITAKPQGSRSRELIENSARIQFDAKAPIETDSITVELSLPPNARALRRRGDCDGDGFLTITDSICLLGRLFGGRTEAWPCGLSASSPGNLGLFDVEGNGTVDLTDAVRILDFLFIGNSLCPAGVPACDGCHLIDDCTNEVCSQ